MEIKFREKAFMMWKCNISTMKGLETIYIIGAGAIGKALAVFLTHQGKDVILLRGSTDYIPAYLEDITIELSGKRSIRETIRVSSISNFGVLTGLVVLTSKSFGNIRLAALLKEKVPVSPIVILQNGLEQPFVDQGFLQIYRCVLFATSQPGSKDSFRFKPVSASPIGIIKGDATALNDIVQKLNTTRFEFRTEFNIQPLIWTKAILNSIFNSVCPLLETDNGIFHREPAALNIAKRVIAECLPIAECRGIFLNATAVLNTLLQISKSSDGQLISTYQDIRHKKRTEIETLNFAITRTAKEFDKYDGIKETRLLGELVYLKAQLALNGTSKRVV
ncbi:ketopantoate reductase C-terminal domain-containing protein [Daejeonella sp.]|uniref:ketopantoate reductase family protein n=1 Tax=Daejeonella sp. TaxID=2805397 RepID=UPI0030C31000